jgi:hypothetical protein
MGTRAKAFDAGRASGWHRIRSRSIHSRRIASASRPAGCVRSPVAPGGGQEETRFSLSLETLLRFFPGSISSEPGIGARILQMANSIFGVAKRFGRRDVWQEFLDDAELRKQHGVTEEEICLLKGFAPLGVITGSGDILFILKQIRSVRQ